MRIIIVTITAASISALLMPRDIEEGGDEQ
jgi:hypothetical protein